MEEFLDALSCFSAIHGVFFSGEEKCISHFMSNLDPKCISTCGILNNFYVEISYCIRRKRMSEVRHIQVTCDSDTR